MTEDTESQSRLLARDGDPDRPSLENRVAFEWDHPRDTLKYRQATLRDQVVLGWLAEALERRPAAVLDVGCAYGNHLLMLNAKLGCDQSVRMVGADLHSEALSYGRAFAMGVAGYENISFREADIEKPLPFEDDSFDAVNFADVLEHLERPVEVLGELRRITRPGGSIVVSTPLKDGLFKRLSEAANRMTRGRLFEAYYAGKHTELDSDGRPIMGQPAGHDHISEMTLAELHQAAGRVGLEVAETRLMPVMSGSSWFDAHPYLLAGLTTLEAVHETLRRPSWAHAVCLRLAVPSSHGQLARFVHVSTRARLTEW